MRTPSSKPQQSSRQGTINKVGFIRQKRNVVRKAETQKKLTEAEWDFVLKNESVMVEAWQCAISVGNQAFRSEARSRRQAQEVARLMKKYNLNPSLAEGVVRGEVRLQDARTDIESVRLGREHNLNPGLAERVVKRELTLEEATAQKRAAFTRRRQEIKAERVARLQEGLAKWRGKQKAQEKKWRQNYYRAWGREPAPKGDVYSRGQRLPGNYGNKQ